MSNGIKVVKRSGDIESLNLEKLHKMVDAACEGLAGVSASQVEINSGIQFYDGITTAEVQEILIRSASDLIDLDHPNYQFVAARLLLFALRKSLYGGMRDHPPLHEQIHNGVEKRIYDKEILDNCISCGTWDRASDVSPQFYGQVKRAVRSIAKKFDKLGINISYLDI